METTFHVSANELDANFLEALKKLFGGQNLVINVVPEADTTDYLLSDAARWEVLFKSMQEAESGNVVAVNLADYRAS